MTQTAEASGAFLHTTASAPSSPAAFADVPTYTTSPPSPCSPDTILTALPPILGSFTRDRGPQGCEPLHSNSFTSESGGPYYLVAISCLCSLAPPSSGHPCLIQTPGANTDTWSCCPARRHHDCCLFSNSTISTISRLGNNSGQTHLLV